MRDARPVMVGMILGAALATANVYMGLKTGWWDSGGILAALVGFAALGRRGPDAVATNVIAQTTASAAAATPAAIGLLGALPALGLLGIGYSWWIILPWAAALSVFGVVLAVALREVVLGEAPLAFPSGAAIAEVMTALHRTGVGAREYAALAASGVAALLALIRDAFHALPQGFFWPRPFRGLSPAELGLGVSTSPLLLGFGLMIDLRSGVGLAMGALVAWGLLAPELVARGVVTGAGYNDLLAWLLWPGAALLVSGGVMSLLLQWRIVGRALASAAQHLRAAGIRRGPGTRFFLLLTGVAIVGLSRMAFGVSVHVGIGVLVVALLAGLVCAYTTGEAGLAPVGPLGQLTQLGLVTLAPGQALGNIAGGHIVSGGVVQTAQMLESFKVGQMTNVSGARQIRAAIAGIAAGVVVSPAAYLLLCRVHPLGSPNLPAPGAMAWKALGQLAANGTRVLPPYAFWAALVGLALGALLELGGRTRLRLLLPSPLLLGLAFLLPMSTTVTVALGTLLRALLGRRVEGETLAAVGAGNVAGESLMGLAIALLTALGLMTV